MNARGYSLNRGLLWLSVVLLVYSCNSGSKLTSSFGKRKYTKGHFFDKPAGMSTVVAKNETRQLRDNKLSKAISNNNITEIITSKPVILSLNSSTVSNCDKGIVNDGKGFNSITQPSPVKNETVTPAPPLETDPRNQIHNNGRPSLILAIVVAIAVAVGYATVAATINTIGTIALIVFLLALVGSLIFAIPTFFTRDLHPKEAWIAALIDIIAIGLLAFGNLFNE